MDPPARTKPMPSYPPELQYIKARLLEKQYRKCITACRELLKAESARGTITASPLHRTFTEFYLASAHDELARTIHVYSCTKIPAVSQAEQLYRDALQSLPDAQDCADALTGLVKAEDHDSLFDQESVSQNSRPSTPDIDARSAAQDAPHWRSPQPTIHIRHDSWPTKSPPVDSPLDSASEKDDLESHESYGQIQTPTRVLPKLQRDYSSISLLQPEKLHPVSQGLMRPIRTGESPRQYHVPPPLPYSGRSYMPSRLPRLNTGPVPSSPVRKQLLTVSEQASPVASSPVSPLGSENIGSDASTVSPISPISPIKWDGVEQQNHLAVSRLNLHIISGHLEAMRIQLERHIQLLEEEKQHILHAQSERTASRFAPAPGTAASNRQEVQRPLPNSHSFWSFTPADTKELEKQKRILAGRQRGWQRMRFDPTRYQALAEKAMAELQGLE